MEETLRRALHRHAPRGAPGATGEEDDGGWALVGAGAQPPLAQDFESLDEELRRVVQQLSGIPGLAPPGEPESDPAKADEEVEEPRRRAFIEHVMRALATAFAATARFEQDPNFRKRANITLEDSLGMRTEDVVKGYVDRDPACLARLLYFVAVDSGVLDPPTIWESDATLHRAWEGQSLRADDPRCEAVPEIPSHFLACEKTASRVRLWASTRRQLGPASAAMAALLETFAPSLLEQDWVHQLLSGSTTAQSPAQGERGADEVSAKEGAPVARHVAWHREKAAQVAIVLQDESLRVLELADGAWQDQAGGALTHEFQRGVSCVAWQPMSDDGVALGCATGVCLWTAGLQWMVHLSSDGLPVGSLAWSPNGRSLACGSALCGDVVLWDVGSRTHVRLHRLRGVTDRLLWSPNGAYLYAGARGLGFRVWEAKSWGCELWSDFSHEVQDATWSGDGRTLLVATGPSRPSAPGPASTGSGDGEDKASVFAISFVHKPPTIGGVLIPLELDLSGSIGPAAGLGLSPGNVRVRNMSWSESSDRLAISFEDSPAVALYAARWDSQLAFFFLGFIWGPPGAIPVEVAFKSSFSAGALLLVNYRYPDGCSAVRLVPLYFDKARV